MPTLGEITERVSKALASFNFQTVTDDKVEVKLKLDRYDYRETHLNEAPWENLNKAMGHLAEFDGPENEDSVREKIRAYRDASEKAALDFHIAVVEPSPAEYALIRQLFEITAQSRFVPLCYTEKTHLSNLARKTYEIIKTSYASGNNPSVKLMKQFEKMVQWQINGRIEDNRDNYLEFAKTILHGPFKRLKQATAATINRDDFFAGPVEIPTIETFDNSEFEAKLRLPDRKKHPVYRAPVLPDNGLGALVQKAQDKINQIVQETGQMPELVINREGLGLNHHAEFAEYCEQLYQSRK